MRYLSVIAIVVSMAGQSWTAQGQETADAASATGDGSDALAEPASDGGIETVLDQSPFVSARASGMGGSLSTLADGSEAAFYNPAGIGGITPGKGGRPLLRGLHFPYLGVAANENATTMNSEFSSEGGATDRGVGQSIVDANAGKRQYGRASYMLDFTIGRTMTAAFSDVQFAAIKSEGATAEEGGISMEYRSLSGTGVGFSATDSQNRIFFGMFSSANNMTLMSVDNASYLDVINVDRRKALLKDNSTRWQGVATNTGIIWNFSKAWRPTLAIVARDVGNTKYKAVEAPSDGTAAETMLVQQDLTSGFSITPELGKSTILNLIVEGHHLTAEDMSLKKKFRAGLECTFGGSGSASLLGVRAGYNSAGVSYGVNLNLGLIQLEAASEAVDIGVDNVSFEERRNVAIFSVNLATE